MKTEAEGLAIAKGLEAQQFAIGKEQTMAVNIAKELASGAQRFMPQNLALTIGEGGSVSSFNGLVPLIMRFLQSREIAGEPSFEPIATVGYSVTGAAD